MDEDQVIDSYYGYLGKNAPAPIVTASVDKLRRDTVAKIALWESSERIAHFDIILNWRQWIDFDAVNVGRCRNTRFWKTKDKYFGIPIM